MIADTNHHHLPGGGGDAGAGAGAASFVRCDVTNESDVQNAVEEAVSMHGKLDINAGIMGSVESDILSCDHADFERVISCPVGPNL